MTICHHSLKHKFPFRESAHAHDIGQFFPSLLTLFFIIHFPPFTSPLGISGKEFEDNLIKTMIIHRVTVHTNIYTYVPWTLLIALYKVDNYDDCK